MEWIWTIGNYIAFHITILDLIWFHAMQLILLPIRYVNKTLYIQIESKIVSLAVTWNRVWGYIWTRGHLDVKTYGNEKKIKELIKSMKECEAKGKPKNVLIISNHTSTMDWIAMYSLFDKLGAAGHIRFMMKKAHQGVPIIGWGATLREMIFLEKNLEKDKQIIEESLSKFRKQQKLPYWVLMYPEGTYVTPQTTELLEKSQAYAKEKKLHERTLTYVLSPRTKAMELCLETNQFDYVLDVTMTYTGASWTPKVGQANPPSMINMYRYRPKEPLDIHCHLEVFDPIQDCFATNKKKLQEWIYKRYTQKDALLACFDKNGAFPNSLNNPQHGLFHVSNSMLSTSDWVVFLMILVSWIAFFYYGFLVTTSKLLFMSTACLTLGHLALTTFMLYYDYIHNNHVLVVSKKTTKKDL
mmetsp:Transcript_3571/g.5252  ORF Transcript_3571/g.5252 Transcript_3571/m.5252 type:complete len:412 (+) Transcript_3571:39-1274(+)